MNKFTVITLSLAFMASSAFGSKTTQCFNPYHVRIVNQSGGPAELLRSKDVAGIRKGNSHAIPNYKSQDVVIQELGAELTIEHGPEDKEKTDRISFYEKTGPLPTIVLKGNTIEARGFNQQHAQQYNVAIRNESGGKAKIVSSCNAAIKGDIDDRTTKDVRVHSGSTVTLNMGPKGSKRMYTIRFSTPIEGGKPMIVLQQGGWFRPAITGKDIRFGATSVSSDRPTMKFGPKESGKKLRAGACGKSREVKRHDVVAPAA